MIFKSSWDRQFVISVSSVRILLTLLYGVFAERSSDAHSHAPPPQLYPPAYRALLVPLHSVIPRESKEMYTPGIGAMTMGRDPILFCPLTCRPSPPFFFPLRHFLYSLFSFPSFLSPTFPVPSSSSCLSFPRLSPYLARGPGSAVNSIAGPGGAR